LSRTSLQNKEKDLESACAVKDTIRLKLEESSRALEAKKREADSFQDNHRCSADQAARLSEDLVRQKLRFEETSRILEATKWGLELSENKCRRSVDASTSLSEELLKQKAMFEETSRLLEATTRELELSEDKRHCSADEATASSEELAKEIGIARGNVSPSLCNKNSTRVFRRQSQSLS
jgi:hypothetical protein